MTRAHPVLPRRFVVAFGAAAIVTILLFFLMTKMILPFGRHAPVVVSHEPLALRFEAPEFSQPPARTEPVAESTNTNRLPRRQLGDRSRDHTSTTERQAKDRASASREPDEMSIDWWDEIRKTVDLMAADELRRWRITQGYDQYVSAMQGPPPASRLSKVRLPDEQYLASHSNGYGETEVKINKSCIARFSTNSNDHSDFARHLPALIFCAPPKTRANPI